MRPQMLAYKRDRCIVQKYMMTKTHAHPVLYMEARTKSIQRCISTWMHETQGFLLSMAEMAANPSLAKDPILHTHQAS